MGQTPPKIPDSPAESAKMPPIPRSAVIVLGAAVWPNGVPSPTLLRRATWAAKVFHSSGALYLVASGGLGKHPPAEAEVIQNICQEQGIPADRIIVENQSRNTAENIAFSRALLVDQRIDHFILVTDRYHAPRARLIARRLGMSCHSDCPPMSGTQRRRVLTAYIREMAALARHILWPNKR